MLHANKPLPLLLLFFLFSRLTLAGDSTAFQFSSRISIDSLKQYLLVLASDSLEGRETGRSGQKKAAAYIAKHFLAAGLKPVSHGTWFQHTYMSTRANAGKNFDVNQMYFLFMRDYFYPSGFGDTLIIIDTIAFAGNGISSGPYDDYAGLAIRNKAVLIFDGEPVNKKGKSWLTGQTGVSDWSRNPLKKLQRAEELGAAMLIIVTDSLEKRIEEYHYGQKPWPRSVIPYVYVSRAMAKNFFPEIDQTILEDARKKIRRKGIPQSFLSVSSARLSFVRDINRMIGENVAGFLEGSDKKEEVLVLTAHYDHLGKKDSLIYYGADDNGSGTSAVMEMARVFSAAAAEGHRPRRSILFMLVSGEEKGLLGSKYYVKYPLVPLDKTIANLNIDMIGRTDEKHDSLGVRDYVYVIGSDKLSTTLHRINEDMNERYAKLQFDYTFNSADDPNRYYYRSDHYNFVKHGIPVIFYFNGTHKDYHRPGDTSEKIQFDLVEKRTRLVFLTAWELANRDERIVVDVKNDIPNKPED